MEKLGKRFKLYRKNLNFTLADLKEKTGLSISYLSDLERGRTDPSLKTLCKLSKAYGISISKIIGECE